MLHTRADEPNSVINARTENSDSLFGTEHNSKINPVGCNQTSTTWTDEQLDRLRGLWATGDSASDVANALNKEFGTIYTRCAVIGKVHRHELPPRRTENRGKWVRENTVRRPRPPPVPDIADLDIPFAQRMTFAQLERGDCKWPVGNPDEPGFFFCGGKSLDTAPYCAGHAKRAYGYTREKNGVTGFKF